MAKDMPCRPMVHGIDTQTARNEVSGSSFRAYSGRNLMYVLDRLIVHARCSYGITQSARYIITLPFSAEKGLARSPYSFYLCALPLYANPSTSWLGTSQKFA
ncbi:hypothetical protein BY996DRAFT_6427538 [Phakopsora pachyrhizi]|nr:hypothetical protein BY996DRAFT_6427538 [Phakopsora pachyrhizi]